MSQEGVSISGRWSYKLSDTDSLKSRAFNARISKEAHGVRL